ncbi:MULTISPECIES: stalk domain-containing protein [Paenibacillus]|uniref:C40 family peptidase n=1 Tax=Paenibacillus TaxID=44249 RepID=UPI002FE2ED6F
MKKPKSKYSLLLLLSAGLITSAVPAYAAGSAAQVSAAPSAAPVNILLDGVRIQPAAAPKIVDGAVLVPMRGLFEAQGAKLAWDGGTKTVTATKGGAKLTYRLGESQADLNGRTMPVDVPGEVVDGHTLVPLRLVSEALGSTVVWEEDARTVRITSAAVIGKEASVRWGVHLRNAPDAESEAAEELLPVGAKVMVLREASPFWLEVRTEDGRTGYISAKPKYTDYASPELREQQADELLAYGQTFAGTPYEFGASPDQTATFDCSSFVKRVFEDMLAVELPRVSYDQAKAGQEVKLEDLRKGDLLFFSARGLDIGHVGIYAGDNQILHTYSKKYGVRLEAFSDSWKERFVTARRVF